MLANCNSLSQTHLIKAGSEFKKHIALLNDVKRDLDGIFKRVRALKSKLANQYPQSYKGDWRSFINRWHSCSMIIYFQKQHPTSLRGR